MRDLGNILKYFQILENSLQPLHTFCHSVALCSLINCYYSDTSAPLTKQLLYAMLSITPINLLSFMQRLSSLQCIHKLIYIQTKTGDLLLYMAMQLIHQQSVNLYPRVHVSCCTPRNCLWQEQRWYQSKCLILNLYFGRLNALFIYTNFKLYYIIQHN